jgi:hypothetical protein
MTKEELLRTYLEDDLFIEKGYLRAGEAETFKWNQGDHNPLIGALKTAIESEDSNEGINVSIRKINQLLNH